MFPEARDEDEDSFRRLVEPYRDELHAHCYRMLGSVHDADDALQDSLVRAWRGIGRFEGRSSPRSWLHRIATNVCIDALARRPKRRVLPIDYAPPSAGGEGGSPVDSAVWVEPYPDASVENGFAAPEARYERREAIELAFVAALQYLPPRQRAVLILRDVLGFSAREVAESLDTTAASVNSALQRARVTVEERLPERSQQAAIRSLGDDQLVALVERFIDAFERGDVDAILAVLAEDATFAMPPYPEWCQGRSAIADSWLMPDGPAPRLRYVQTGASGQIALGTYALDHDGARYLPLALDVLEFGDGGITSVIAFREPRVLERFGLPDQLAA